LSLNLYLVDMRSKVSLFWRYLNDRYKF